MSKECPNCGEKIKDNFIKKNIIVSEDIINEINDYYNMDSKAYCSSCSKKLLNKKKKEKQEKIEKLKQDMKKLGHQLSKNMPIVTTHSPFDWKYKTCGIVTGLSNMGTGFLSAFNSSISDSFGMESNSYNKKINKSEKKCLNQLKSKTLKLGGNAIIGVDIDYNEIGGDKQIQMVAMAGTAVKLENISKVMNGQFDTEKYIEKCKLFYNIKNKLKKLLDESKIKKNEHNASRYNKKYERILKTLDK